ncbi:MAG: phenylalanine--tRNA ligase subunit beta, partial [bacterium]
MRTPISWLSDYVNLPDDTGRIVYDLTQIGLEVEDVIRPSRSLDGLLIVTLENVEDHPNNSELTVCTLSDGSSDKTTVVTAASNLTPESQYVWAPPGSTLQDQIVETENLSGVPSQGMLCSLEELGLTGSSAALLELSDDFEAGTDPVEALDLSQPLLDIDLTPNRSDCLSIMGIARDYATAQDRQLSEPTVNGPDSFNGSDDNLAITIEAPERCRHYTGITISGLTPEKSTPSLQKRLIQMGVQPRNCIVDATNYVLFEMGNPLHAFDRDTITAPITVRAAGSEESLTTLDGSDLDLNSDDLVIADSTGPQALAGVMGGQNSGVTPDTDSVLLEGAYFTPAGIRRTSSRHQLSTDS